MGGGEGEDVGEPGVLQRGNVVCVYPIVDIVQIALCMGESVCVCVCVCRLCVSYTSKFTLNCTKILCGPTAWPIPRPCAISICGLGMGPVG